MSHLTDAETNTEGLSDLPIVTHHGDWILKFRMSVMKHKSLTILLIWFFQIKCIWESDHRFLSYDFRPQAAISVTFLRLCNW